MRRFVAPLAQRSAAPLLSFSNVAKRARDGGRELPVLRDVSFELGAAESLGVYGARRSGKSTLARLAAGIEPADAGSIRFEGSDLAGMSPGGRTRLLRGTFGLLAGDGPAPNGGRTVMDHVALAAGSAGCSLRQARRRALGALDAAGVAGISAEEMNGALPAAERARVMLASALVHDPKLLIVDEPAPLPSLVERQRFCTLLQSLAGERDMALLLVSEELSALRGSAMLASLSNGELCHTQDGATVVELPRRRAARESL